MTEQEAVALGGSGWWRGKTALEIVRFQLYETRLCMPFAVFHEAVESVLGRPVYTHEFAEPRLLREEFSGGRQAPSGDEVVAQMVRLMGRKEGQ